MSSSHRVEQAIVPGSENDHVVPVLPNELVTSLRPVVIPTRDFLAHIRLQFMVPCGAPAIVYGAGIEVSI